jgi:hypothetical protein
LAPELFVDWRKIAITLINAKSKSFCFRSLVKLPVSETGGSEREFAAKFNGGDEGAWKFHVNKRRGGARLGGLWRFALCSAPFALIPSTRPPLITA